MIRVTQKLSAKLEKVQAELIWLLRTLWEDGHHLFFIGLTNVVDELERLVQSDPKAKGMISSYVADLVSDLAVFSEAIRQLKIYQPWAQTFEKLLVDKEGDIEKRFAQRTNGWGLVMAALDGPNQMKIVRLGEPGGRKFYYPVDKRRTKENVEAMRSAEQNLDAFWLSVDQNMRIRMGNKLEGTALWHLLSQSRILQRTSEWVKPDEQAKEEQKVDVVAITKPLSELYLDLELRTERTIDRGSRTAKLPTAKAKTRGVPALSATATETFSSGDQPDTHPTFQLDARALKVFRTLFYTPSLTATPGEVSWTDFLHAMVSAGFKPEKLYGSVWQFRPTKLDVERSIQFHEPHPSGKLPYKTARRFGRRLNRAYGWGGEMFVPKEAVVCEER